MKVSSWTEWGELKSVIVGRADGARVPMNNKSLLAINYADKLKDSSFVPPSGPYPEQVIQEANEDLENFCDHLSKLGITVFRPDDFDTSKVNSNGIWETDGYYTYCPRDSVLIHGHHIIEAPMPLRARQVESRSMHSIFDKSEAKEHWVSAPTPKLADDSYDTEEVHKDKLTLTEVEPAFDAANILRCGRDLFYLISNSGNKAGADWLQDHMGSDFRVHRLENIYSYMHLDSTISFIKPGLVLLNPERINEDNLPMPLRSWDKIWCADPVDIGFHEPYNHASVWVGMNLFMINPGLAVVEERQKPLIDQLETHGIEVLPLPIRHARTLGGCFHCVTLDLHREGELEDYFS